MKKLVFMLSAIVLIVAPGSVVQAQNACTAARLMEAAKLTACETKCNAKAINKGASLPETGGLGCRIKCKTKNSAAIFKIELKYSTECPTLNWPSVQKKIDDSSDERTCQGGANDLAVCTEQSECPGGVCLQLAGLVPDLDCGLTFGSLPFKSKCSARKYKEAGKKAAAILKCHAKAVKKGVAVDSTCVTKAGDKFLLTQCIKAVAKGDCHGPRHNLCNIQVPDCATLEQRVDLFVSDVLAIPGIAP